MTTCRSGHTSPTIAEQSAQRISFACDRCGKRMGVLASHYNLFDCAHCGKPYWALRPLRGGELVAFPWPGTPEMAKYNRDQKQFREMERAVAAA